MSLFLDSEYKNWFSNLKTTIKQRQIKAASQVNSELILLYWELGNQITEKQKLSKWGSGFIDQLSTDLQQEFPNTSGFSSYNLRFCKNFYLFYNQLEIQEQVVPKNQNNDLIEEQLVPEKEKDFFKTKDNFEVEFALKDINKPIGVSEFNYSQLPENIKKELPSFEELQKEFLKIESQTKI